MAAAPLPVVAFASLSAMEAHLSGCAPDDPGFWLKLAKKGAPAATITKAEAIEAALCYGWIDGQLGTHDAHHFVVRMTRRRPGSRWSAVNRETAERLVSEGRMRPSGQAEIDLAKANDRWDSAYLSQSRAGVPDDLAAAIAKDRKAAKMFAELDGANRYAIIYRVNDVKRADTRTRKIAEYVAMLARGEKLHAPRTRPKKSG